MYGVRLKNTWIYAKDFGLNSGSYGGTLEYLSEHALGRQVYRQWVAGLERAETGGWQQGLLGGSYDYLDSKLWPSQLRQGQGEE